MIRLVRMFSIMMLAVAGAACSGGSGVEPTPPANDTVEPAPVEPNSPPAPTEPSVPPSPPVVPPPSAPPPPKSPTSPQPPKPSAPSPPAPTVPTPSPVGVWQGFTPDDGRRMVGLVLPNRRTWFIYSMPAGNVDIEGGMIVGTLNTSGGNWTMNPTFVVNVDDGTNAIVRATGTWLDNLRLTGQLQNNPLNEPSKVDLTFDPQSDVAFALNTVAGRYTGPRSPMHELTISPNGEITGILGSGCTLSGQAVPNGATADATITFNELCDHANETVRGVLWVDGPTRKIVVAGVSQDQRAAWAFMGRR